MKKIIKRTLCYSVLLSLVLSTSHTLCSAATYQITNQELTRLEIIFNQLETNNKKLIEDLKASKQDLETSQQQLLQYQKDLEEVQIILNQSKTELQIAKTNLETAQSSLKKANESLSKYEKEVKSEIMSLKIQRDLSILAIIGVAIFKK